MKRVRAVTLSLALLPLPLLLPGDASAQTEMIARMRMGNEVPPATNPVTTTGQPRPRSYGFARFRLSADQTFMTFVATVRNIDITGSQTADINDNLLAAHIHASATSTPSTTAGVVFGFFGAPFNDNNPNDVVVTPFVDAVGGRISSKWDLPEGQNTTLAAQIPNLTSGRAYINFHTTQFRGGEIRGTLQVVPEPATLLLLGSGLAGIGAAARRRRRATDA